MRSAVRAPAPAEFPLALCIVLLAIAASAGALLFPDLYLDPPAILPAMRGQDLVTLAVAPLLLAAAGLASRGRVRARLVEIGIAGYLLYTYTGAAFGYRLNRLFLIYVALCSLSACALIVAVRRLDGVDLGRHFDRNAPRRQVAVFLAVIAVLLAAIELGEIGRFLVTGAVPDSVQRAGGVTFFPYVLDLGFVAPLSIAAAIGLWHATAWGYALAAILLIKATTMGSALVSMTWFTARAGLDGDGLTPFYATLTASGIWWSIRFLRHCR